MPRRDLLLESCEDRILCSAVPNVTINAPPNPKIGDKIPVTVTFDNATGTNPGYGPYIDLVLQHATGATGTGGGVDYVVGSDTATYLGANVTVTKLTFQAADAAHPLGPWVLHPYAKDSSGNPEVVYAPAGYGVGDTLLVLQLPFGSFTPTQPAATVNLDLTVSNLTELNRGLQISARGGFEFGNDALDNPTTDPSIVGNYQEATIVPQLMTVTTTYLGPEDETATGPDFLQQYRVDVDVADGQTVTNLNIIDALSNNEQFAGIVSTLDHNGNNVATTTLASPSTTTPGGTLDVEFASVTGVAGGPDASVIFNFYVPRIDNGSAVIVPANSGAPNTATDTASAQATWNPIDPGDPKNVNVTASPSATSTVTVKSIATQESVVDLNNGTSANAIPGDVLEYTVQMQVSDYFAMQNLDLSDIISDGQRIDTSFTPTITWTEQGSTFTTQAMLSNDYTVTPHYSSGDLSITDGTDGTTDIAFNVSGEIARQPGHDGTLLGGGVPATGTSSPENNPPLNPGGAATVTIKFRTIIQDSFTDNAPSGDAKLDGGDVLSSTVIASGNVLNVADAKTPTGSTATDNSGASIAIINSTVSKSIYAIDGNTNLSAFTDSSGKVQVKPGDTVTYQLEYQLPIGSVENLVLTDYLPLPIFDATTITTFDSSRGTAAPAAGSWKIGPADTLGAVDNITPSISTDAAGNSISFNYGTTDDHTNTPKTADILFTVAVGSSPFADGLFLTNQVQASQNNTQQPTTKVTSNAIVQVQLDEPEFLAIYKGVVATTEGGGQTLGGLTFSPVSGNGFTGTLVGSDNAAAIGASDDLTGTDDAGDDVRYAVVLQNVGRADAYDVSFSDTVPPGEVSNYTTASAFAAGTNFKVYTGAGTLLTPGTDYTLTWDSTNKTFGVTLTNEANGGISRGYNANTDTNITDGSNSVVVLYDLTLATTAQAGQTITNTATLTNYTNKAGGTNFIPNGLTDTASVSVSRPTLTKALVGTSVTDTGNNAANQATIGELATYTLTLTVPEGTTSDASIVDTMDPGLSFSSVTSVNYSANVSSTTTPGIGANPANVTISGNTLTFNFGTITDTDTNNSVPETITITYQARVTNENSDSAHSTGNQAGVTLSNAATFDGQYTNSPTGTATNYSVNQTTPTTTLTIVEPALTVTTGASTSAGGPFTSNVTGVDAGDTVYYQVQIKNAGGPTAYNTTLNDTLPTLTGATIVSATGGGVTPSSFTLSGTSLTTSSATGIDIAGGTTITIIVSGQIPDGTNAGSTLTNTANAQWTSLPGVDPTERTGAGGVGTDGAVLNNYAAKATASFTENGPEIDMVFQGGTITPDDTSVASTTGANVVVGESVLYDILVTLPEGTSQSLRVQDLIPTGMRLDMSFNGGTGYQIITTAAGDSTLLSADFSDPTALSGATLTAIGSGTLGKDGVGAQINFGNVTVTADNNPNNNAFVIRVRGIVDDVIANQSGTNIKNAAQIVYTSANTIVADPTPNDHTVTVVEPTLTMGETVNSTAADAGDPVNYTITISNNSATSQTEAYDVTLSDVLPSVLDGATISGITTTGGATATASDLQISGGTLQSATPFDMPLNSTVVLTVSGTLDGSVQSGQSISNTTQAFWTSTPGSNPDERTGAGNPNPTSGTVNASLLDNYAIASTAVTTTVASPMVVKTVANTSLNGLDGDVTPGEIVTYQIAVTLPEGTTNGLVITDLLPNGMAYVPGSIVLDTTGFNGAVAAPTDSPASGTTYTDGMDIKFTFGTITVAGDNDPNNNTFRFTYQAVVDDVASNNGLAPSPTVLPNSTSYVTSVITTPQSQAAVDVTVVEPNLSLNHTLTTASTKDAGDAFTDTVTIAHTANSTSEAYDLVVDDPFATDLNVTGFTALIGGTDVSSQFQLVTVAGVQHLQTVSSTGLNLALGQTLTITSTGTLQNSVTPSETITNNATLGYSDYPGDRSPTGGFDPNPTVITDHERLYNTSGSASITTSAPSVTKAIVTTSLNGNDGLVTPGEIVTYQITVTVPEGTTPNLVITDSLPNGMAYVPGSVVINSSSFNGVITGPTVAPATGSTYLDGTDMVFKFASVTSPGDNITTNNSFSFTYQAVVLDTAENTGTQGAQTTLTNSTTFSANGGASQSGTGSPSVTVVEPRLGVTETLSYDSGKTTGDAGDAVTATTVISHQSISEETAYGVTFDDPLSPDLTVSSFTVVDSMGNDLSSNFQLVTIGGVQHLQTIAGANIDLAQGVSLTVTAHGTIASTATPNETITNSPAITYSSYPGDRSATGGFDPDPDVTTDHERIYNASTSQSLTTAEGSITKSLFNTSLAGTTGSNVAIGEQVTYAVTVTLPEGTMPNLTVTDLLPSGLQYVSSSIDTSSFGGTLNAPTITNSGNNVTYSFDTATVNADNDPSNNSFTIYVTAQVMDVAGNNGLHTAPGSQTTLANQASLAITGEPSSTTPPVTVTVVQPQLTVTKTASDTKPDIGETETYTLTISNTGAASTETAYQLNIGDVIPAGMTFLPGSVIVSAPGDATFTNNSTASQLLIQLSQLDLGATATITYQATVNATVSPGSVINNTVGVNYNSLPTSPSGRAGTASATNSVTVNAATLSGKIYVDANGNGQFDSGETGLSGISVQLTGTDITGNTVSLTTTTDTNGNYTFTNLAAGTYTIAEVNQPSGYLDGVETVGNPFGGSANNALGSDTISNVVILSHSTTAGTNYNFGELQGSSLAGSVYQDANDNGIRDGGETGIAGVQVQLTGTDAFGQVVSFTTTTDSSGNYIFSGTGGLGLRPGTYTITEVVQPAGYLDGKDAAGTSGGNATTVNDQISGINLATNTAATKYNFGELLPGTISGAVYEDANNNGTKDSGEGGISGVKVTVTGIDDLGNPVNLSAFTDAGGLYSFTNLRPGTYTITETPPSGYLDGKDTLGSPGGGTAGSDVFTGVTMVSGATDANYNFGELKPSSVSGFVYNDVNNNGTMDSGEAGIANVTVKLTGTNDLGSVSLTTTTLADGSFSFANLRPGTYTVIETQPGGFLEGKDTTGSLGGSTATNDSIGSFTLPSNTNATNYRFGELLPSSLSGTAYIDANDNGVLDAGETRQAGVTVTLTGTDDLGNAVSVTTTTAGDGTYTFASLRPGSYTLTETQPTGLLDGLEHVGSLGGAANTAPDSDTISGITVNQNNSGGAYDFGDLRPASLAGSVYVDTNNNGVKDPGETGIAGVTVTLTGTDDRGNTVNVSTNTLANGTYSFTNLRPGDYTITETQPAAYLDGQDTIGSPGGTAGNDVFSNIVVTEGTIGTQNNFGELKPSSLSGFVYEDANNNGVKEPGETGIAGVTLTLTGTDDLGDSVNFTTTTDANGAYSFAGLRPGDYQIAETQPAAYLDGTDAVGTQGGNITGGVNGDTISNIVLSSNTNGASNNFGELVPSTISGNVYVDHNTNGVLDPGEPGIAGTQITLTGQDDRGNAVSVTTTTAADGTYAFVDLRPGQYTLTETQPSGYLDGKDAAGPNGGTVGNDVISNITLNSHTTAPGYNFGEERPSSLSGYVYHDANNDGVRSAGETGIAGVTITLTGTDFQGNSVSLSTMTLADGSYTFSNLAPGTYTIAEMQPAGYLDGKDTIGTPGGSTSNDTFSNILLNENVNGAENDFGELIAATASGHVYSDLNNNGVIDSGESGIGGVTVTLTGTDDLGGVSLTTTTAADGTYSFGDLRPGTYTLTETQPSGYLDGKETAGTAGGTVDNTTDSNVIQNFTLASNGTTTGNNFGELIPSSLAGQVFSDLNDNGKLDGSEAGIAGVGITLTGTDDRGNAVNFATTTAGDGTYSFGNLRPGTYTITETQPAGFLDGADTVGTQGGSNSTNDTISAVPVVSGTTGTANNFAELLPSKISGSVYIDTNENGVQDGAEAGIAGVSLQLTGTDDLGNSVSLTATTAGDGTYTFDNLRPGTYAVTETQPAGYLDGKDTVGPVGGNNSVNDTISSIVVTPNTNAGGNTFGELRPSTISGTVFVDANNNGIQDGVDPGRAGVTLTLTGTNDLGQSVTLTTTTGANGTYAFNDLRPGTYTLKETQPADLLDGKDTLGTQGGTASNDTFTFTIGENTNGTDNNFAELAPAVISGSVYSDNNNNGIRDPKEPGVPNVQITLTGTDDLNNSVTLTTITDKNGNYAFSDLRPGTYTVSEKQPGGYSEGKDTAGPLGGDATTVKDIISGITIGSGDIASGNIFGEHPIPPVVTAADPLPIVKKKSDPLPDPGLPFAFDGFNDFASESRPTSPALPLVGTVDIWGPALLPLEPIYSGEADPGATLRVDVYGANGDLLASQSVMADTGGNWLVNFGDVQMRDVPREVVVVQTNAPYSFGSDAGHNLRTYYAPTAINPGEFLEPIHDAEISDDPAPLLGGLDLSNPIELGTVKYGAEILPSEGVASGN